MIRKLIDDLKRDEGFRDRPYDDSLGFQSIGYGFLIDPRKRGRLPQKVADFWLETLVEERAEELAAKWPAFDEQPEDVQRALTNMAYQLGVKGVLNFKRMIAALEAGDRETAAVEALDSRWRQQTPERANRIADLIRGHA